MLASHREPPRYARSPRGVGHETLGIPSHARNPPPSPPDPASLWSPACHTPRATRGTPTPACPIPASPLFLPVHGSPPCSVPHPAAAPPLRGRLPRAARDESRPGHPCSSRTPPPQSLPSPGALPAL